MLKHNLRLRLGNMGSQLNPARSIEGVFDRIRVGSGADELETELFRHADRGAMMRCRADDEHFQFGLRECPIDDRGKRFGAMALAMKAGQERVAHLRFPGGVRRSEEAQAANERVVGRVSNLSRFFYDGWISHRHR